MQSVRKRPSKTDQKDLPRTLHSCERTSITVIIIIRHGLLQGLLPSFLERELSTEKLLHRERRRKRYYVVPNKAMGHAICSFITWRITIFFLGFFTTVLAFEDTSMVQKLKEKLLIKNRYDKHVRPMIHHSNTTVVKIRLTPLYLIDFDEDQSLMTMDTWLALTWDDIRLIWKKEEYDGISHLNMGDGVLWQPDIVLYNSHYSNIDPKGNTHSLVYPSGNVLWVPPATFTTRCYAEDLHLYPEDVQRCDIILGSWTQHGYQIELKLYDNETLDLSNFRDSNPRWEMLSKKINVSVEVKYYDCCEEPYYSVKAIFYLKRKYPGHLRVVFVPCLMVMLMTLSLFWVPVLSGRKVTFGAFLFLILTLLMLYVAISTKPTSAQYYAVSFIRSMMYVVMFAVLAEVVVMNMASIRSPYRPPQLVLGFLSAAAVKVLLVWSLIDATDETDQDELQAQENGKAPTPSFRNEWIVVATALDRVLFVVFGIICIAMYSK